MHLQSVLSKCAIAGVLLVGATDPTCVDAQTTSAPQPTSVPQSTSAPVNKSTTKTVPQPPVVREVPFPSARGGPLQIPIEGLSDTISLVSAGRRLFGLCWAGGTPPYSVALQDTNAQPILRDSGIAGKELTKNSEFVDLRAGSYNLTVSDSVGTRANGRFTAVLPSDIPVATTSSGAAGDILAQASALVSQGPTFDYEAYLRLLAIPTDNPEAQRMRDDICHRQYEATVAEASVEGFPDTEIILADASDLSSGQFAGAAFYYAYLTKQGALLSEAIYEYETSSADNFNKSNAKVSSSQTQLQQATTLFEYGVTDDLAVGAEISAIFETFKEEAAPGQLPFTGPSPRDSSWSDPTFLALYRILNQADAPATAFLRSSYSPAIVKNGQQVVDVGGTIIREQDDYAIAGVFDANYTGPSPSLSLAGGTNVKLASDWRYNATLQSQVRLGDRWSVGLALGYQLPYDRLEFDNSNAPFTESIHVDGIPSVFSSVSYFVIPDRFRVSLSYYHYFSTQDDVSVASQLTGLTRTAGTDVVSLVLSSNASIDDIHF